VHWRVVRMDELVLLGTIAQRWSFDLGPGHPVVHAGRGDAPSEARMR